MAAALCRVVASQPFVDTSTNPACAPQLCPGPYGPQNYASYKERTLHTMTNIVRTRPDKYNTTYACVVASRPPLRYDQGCHQAAKQQSWLLEQRGCPFQHNTCDRFCVLFNGSCSFSNRMIAYVEDDWTGLGENIQQSSATNLWSVLNAWLASPGHCRGIFSPSVAFMGVGAVAYSYTQTFASFASRQFTGTAPLVDGSHVVENGRLRFIVSAPGCILSYNGTRYRMAGTSATFAMPRGGCVSYFFMKDASRMPATGVFLTHGVSTCTTNWRA